MPPTCSASATGWPPSTEPLSGQAELSGAEPNIRVRVAANGGRGDLRVRVELTPDPQAQGHWFEYAIDQSYLPETIRQLDAVLELFPVRGRAPDASTLDLP